MSDKAEQALEACKVAHTAWREHRSQFPERTMELALKLRDLRDAHVSNTAFGEALEGAGLGEKVLNDKDRAALLHMAEHRKVATKILKQTDRWSPQHIWRLEIRPVLIEKGTIEPRERTAAEPADVGGSEPVKTNTLLPMNAYDPIDCLISLGQTYSTPAEWEALLQALDQPTRAELASVDAVQALRELVDLLEGKAAEPTETVAEPVAA